LQKYDVSWTDLAQNWVQLRAFMDMMMDFVIHNSEEFLEQLSDYQAF
jgi:hypothetical protein